MLAALSRAKKSIVAIAIVHVAFVTAGIVLTHSGNRFALEQRDHIVGRAVSTDASMKAFAGGHRLRAGLLDFSANLLLGAVPQTVSGVAVLPAFAFAAARGWVGGIVSVDGDHRSRLRDSHERTYYLGVLLLQLLPYSLTGGAGLYLGLAWYRSWKHGPKTRWMHALPGRAIKDVGWTYLVSVPLFLLASLAEFLLR